jgi:hypothetical protein
MVRREDSATSRWREAFSGCTGILEALAKASDDKGQAAARAWWTICMSSRLDECKGLYGEWKGQAAAALPTKQLTAEHTEDAIRLPGFEPMAQCLIDTGAAVGVDPAATLEHVEAEGIRMQAATEWARAVREVSPLRTRLQESFLSTKTRAGFFSAAKSRVTLAPSAGEMGIDELRTCQVWMYGLASRLRACQDDARKFAELAGMDDPNSPLQGYDESRWDPRAPAWQQMEACVHNQASRAGTDADTAWRHAKQSHEHPDPR